MSSLNVVDLRSMKEVYNYHNSGAFSQPVTVSLSPDARFLLYTSTVSDSTVVRDVRTWSVIHTRDREKYGNTTAPRFCFSSQPSTIVSATYQPTVIQGWKADTGKPLFNIRPFDIFTHLQFGGTSDGKWLVTGASNGEVIINPLYAYA